MQEYLSVGEAATKLGVARSTLMHWIWSSKIPSMRRGRWWFILKSDVDARIEERVA